MGMWGPQVGAPGVLKNLSGRPQGRKIFVAIFTCYLHFSLSVNLLGGYRAYLKRLNVEADLRIQMTLKMSNNAQFSLHFFLFVAAFLFLFSLNLVF